MIREVKMFAVFCDNCGKQCTDDDAGFCAWTDTVGAEESASESGWLIDESLDGVKYPKHYCPDCYSYDNDDNLVLKTIDQ